MRRFILLTSLLVSLPPAAPAAEKAPVKFEQALTEAKTVTECARLLQAEINGLADQILKVKDKASLDGVNAAIVKSSEHVIGIAAKLKTMPVPSPAEREKIHAEMEAANTAAAGRQQAAVQAHMDAMPDELRGSVMKNLVAFYAKLDSQKDLFARYFQPDKKAETKPAAK